jgi:hypothetical protein
MGIGWKNPINWADPIGWADGGVKWASPELEENDGDEAGGDGDAERGV